MLCQRRRQRETGMLPSQARSLTVLQTGGFPLVMKMALAITHMSTLYTIPDWPTIHASGKSNNQYCIYM